MKPVRKILVATPLKGGLPPEYFRSMFSILHAKVPDAAFAYCFLGGTSIQWARDEIAAYLYQQKFDEILFWDKDLQPSIAQVVRLCSHDVPIVCAAYCHRALDIYWHLDMVPGGQPDEHGLWPANRAGIGFSKVRKDVFDRLKAKFPERAYIKQDGGCDPVPLHEFFPMGITGPCSDEGKLERIRKEMAEAPECEVINRIQHILDDADYASNRILGEDFYFCKLLKEAGIPLLVDPALIIPHAGETLFPIPTHDLERMLREDWRREERSNNSTGFSIVIPNAPLWPDDYLSPDLAGDHCLDVLEGCYDLPYHPETAPVILDLGANVGAFLRWAGVRWKGAAIHCYEPHPGNFSLLEKTRQTYCSTWNTQLNQLAVGKQASRGVLIQQGLNCGEWSLYPQDGAPIPSGGVEVDIISASDLPKADILKIDAEGAELDILETLHLAGRLKEFSAIMVEFHLAKHATMIRQLMQANGLVETGHIIHSEHRGILKFMRIQP